MLPLFIVAPCLDRLETYVHAPASRTPLSHRRPPGVPLMCALKMSKNALPAHECRQISVEPSRNKYLPCLLYLVHDKATKYRIRLPVVHAELKRGWGGGKVLRFGCGGEANTWHQVFHSNFGGDLKKQRIFKR